LAAPKFYDVLPTKKGCRLAALNVIHFTFALAAFPGFLIEIVPFHIHEHVQLSVRAGVFFTFICALPGVQADTMAGTQGCGVNVPIAADVAVCT
jgi:hypothetical protein